MRNALLVALAMVALAVVANARRPATVTKPAYDARNRTSREMLADPTKLKTQIPPDTIILYSTDFQFGSTCGSPWTSVDITAQTGDYFHVEDYIGLPMVPLEGAQSLWCGTVAAPGPVCGFAALPGYGDNWNQAFCTIACIPVAGGLGVAFLMSLDTEPGYDAVTLEVTNDCTGSTGWTVVDGGPGVWDGTFAAAIGDVYPMPDDDYLVRLRFQSDASWSDEDGLIDTDGAAHIDMLTVEGLPVEDFEGEIDGALAATDWISCTPTGYGDFMGLFPGAQMLQDDPCTSNLSCMWAAVSGSLSDYACGGHPLVASVPFGNARGQYIANEIWSPDIPLVGVGTTVLLEFMVYRDLPFDNLIFYTWHVRTTDAFGCDSFWADRSNIYYGDQKDWHRHVESVGNLLDLGGGVSMNVAIGVVDMCRSWCGSRGTGVCHSPAPLIDQVRVMRVDESGPQWSINEAEQFQDTFAEDGTLTGTARADIAADMLPPGDPAILPSDHAAVRVEDPIAGLALDPLVGGFAVYLFASVRPLGQPGKSDLGLQAPETRLGLPRFPVVGFWVDDSGISWTQIRADIEFVGGVPQPDRFCVDLKDDLFVPGDTVYFFYGALNPVMDEKYAYGADLQLTGTDQEIAAANASEFTILPAGGFNRGGDILYVDGAGGDAGQSAFDVALQHLVLKDLVDRYDVRAPSSNLGNRLAGRVTDVGVQLLGAYRKILWDCGDVATTLGDGSGSPEKTDDYALVNEFLDGLTAPGGVYIAGDDVAETLSDYAGASAMAFLGGYIDYALTADDAEPVYGTAPTVLPAVASIFVDDALLNGQCPQQNDFDVMEPFVPSTMELSYGADAADNGAVIAQVTTNPEAEDVAVVFSGFGFAFLSDNDTDGVPDRAQHLYDIITFLGNVIDEPTTAAPIKINALAQNYPNPFNPQTTLAFSLRQRGQLSLVIYDVSGARVRTLVDEELPAGEHTRVWDGRNEAGEVVSSGLYFYRLVAGDFTETKKMVLLK